MTAVNYSKLQTIAKNTLLNVFNAVPLIVRFPDNSTISTVGVFDNTALGQTVDIDNIQNATGITGEVGRVAIVPGIDFYNKTSNSTKTPQVNGTVEWSINMVSFVKVINSVQKTEPVPNTPILYVLGIE
jgi:hypothetical protein